MLKDRKWHERSRDERLASILWPMQTSSETQREMAELAAREGRRSPQEALAERRRNDDGRAKGVK
jgi:hypothetical protein